MDVALRLTIAPQTEPIEGRVRLPDGSDAAFEGYVQLIALLERLREGPESAARPDEADVAR